MDDATAGQANEIDTNAGGRAGSRLRWALLLAGIVGLIAAVRTLPLDRWISDLQGWVDSFGALGIVVYAGVYVVGALMFVPGSAITLAAGPIFGLWVGTAVVSVASTTAAALAFLIARYLARDAVARRAAGNARFDAIDRAIGAKGWRIVALLRLSPAVPFSLGNYLYGLTAIRFWPYVIASWIAMLPGTFMYVYLGYAGAQGLAAASAGLDREGGAAGSTGQQVLTAVGLVATVVVTVYVTRLAMKAVREQTDIGAAPGVTPEERS